MNDLRISLRLTFILIVLFGLVYPVFIWAVGRIAPNAADGFPIKVHGSVVGYENIGEKFTDDKYFWGRPSAVDYNAAASGGSNQGPTNPDHIAAVKARIDSFMVHNAGVQPGDIPTDLVTASGSGLDPHISPQSARIQIARIARVRGLSETRLRSLVDEHIEHPIFGFFGTERVNVLKLNIALDELK
ncbi:MAG: potassium-transporting ATPase subunit KdpC [Bacteroidetes bacterium]|nr:potassium-transporting ATPase subunit KdpC [Bacteroidota bacterium]